MMANDKYWFMDCFSHNAMCGKDFPVNTYYSESLDRLTEDTKRVLSSNIAGIDEVRIARTTNGYAPLPCDTVKSPEQPATDPRPNTWVEPTFDCSDYWGVKAAQFVVAGLVGGVLGMLLAMALFAVLS